MPVGNQEEHGVCRVGCRMKNIRFVAAWDCNTQLQAVKKKLEVSKLFDLNTITMDLKEEEKSIIETGWYGDCDANDMMFVVDLDKQLDVEEPNAKDHAAIAKKFVQGPPTYIDLEVVVNQWLNLGDCYHLLWRLLVPWPLNWLLGLLPRFTWMSWKLKV